MQATNLKKMKAVTSFEIIDNPQVIGNRDMPALGGQVTLYEDGSVFSAKTGLFYAPEKEDGEPWRLRKSFDASKSIKPGDRYIQAKSSRQILLQRYGLVG
jgi:hypothetical protein